MADGISVDEALDLGSLTLKNIARDEIEYVLAHNNYPMLEKLYRGREVDVQTGKIISRQIVLGSTGNARHTKLFVDDVTNIRNIVKEIQVPWKHFVNSFAYEAREVLVQGGPEGFVNLMKVRKTNMMVEAADLLEQQAWGAPDSATDVTNPFGIPYWLPIGAADAEGYAGIEPKYKDGNSITAGAGGIAATTFTGWKSYYADYTSGQWEDFLEKLGRAFRKTKFQSPATVEDIGTGPLSAFKLYTSDAALTALETIARHSDDRVGFDLGKYAGRLAFNRVPIDYVDILDSTATGYDASIHGVDPFYGINWKYIEPVILKGDRFRVSPPQKNTTANHNLLSVFLDLTYNYICTNRNKAGFVLSQVS